MQAARRVCFGSQRSNVLNIVPRSYHSSLAVCTLRSAERPAARAARKSHVLQTYRAASAEATARELSQQSVDELAEEDVGEEQVEEAKEKQHQRPWMREGVDHAPVRRQRSAGAMTKGNDSIHRCSQAQAHRDPRKATDYPFTPSQIGHALDNGRHQYRSKRCRAACPLGASTAASLIS